MKYLLWILFCIGFSFPLFAQETSPRPLPDWVAMIDNSKTNYFEAVKAFNEFWKNRVKPVEEMDMGEEEEKEKKAMKAYLATLSVAERNYWDQLQYHYKRFKRWKQDVLPYVQSDGRILSEEERIAIWNKQQLEMKNNKR